MINTHTKYYFKYDFIIDGIWDYEENFYNNLDKNKNYYEIIDNEIQLFIFGSVSNQDIKCLTLEDILKVFPDFDHNFSISINTTHSYNSFRWNRDLTIDEIFYLTLKYNYISEFIEEVNEYG